MNIDRIEIDLDLDNTNSVGMLLLQPRITVEKHAPFRITESSRICLKAAIRESMELAMAAPMPGGKQSSFLIIPEFCLPSDFYNPLDSIVSNDKWHRNTVVIAGMEPVLGGKFNELVAQSDNPPECRPTLNDDVIVNAVCTWIKTSTGIVKRYLQPKLNASKPEMAAQKFYGGTYVLLLQTNELSFASLICFDAIAKEAHNPVLKNILKTMSVGLPKGQSINLDLLFVIQHNHSFSSQYSHGSMGNGAQDDSLPPAQIVTPVVALTFPLPACSRWLEEVPFLADRS